MTKNAVEVITSVQRRRRWSVEEKRRIVAAAIEPGAVASEVARAAGIYPSQLFRWRQQLCGPARETPAFSPVAIVPAPAASSMIEVEFASGARLRITGAVDPAMVSAIDHGAGRGSGGDDPGPERGSGVACDAATPTCARALTGWRCWCRRRCGAIRTVAISRVPRPARLADQGSLARRAQGMSLYAKRLERGRFIWPSTAPREGADGDDHAGAAGIHAGRHRLAQSAAHLAAHGGGLSCDPVRLTTQRC